MDSNGFGIARRVGELESWRVGDPRASDSEKTTSLYGRAAAGLGFEHARHAHLTAKKRHLSLSLIVLQVLQITHTRFFLRSVEAPECTFSLNPAPPSRLGILHIHTQVPEVEDYRIIYTHRCQRCQSVHFHSTPRRQADWAD